MENDDATYEAERQKWLESYLPTYRDQLLRMGIPKEQVDGYIRLAWTDPAIHIRSVEDYKRACSLHEEMAKEVQKGDFLSPAAVRLHVLGGEMTRFEQQYEEEHGYLPDTE
jgi:hypothetical protein